MGNKDKRAKKSKLKAKAARITRHRNKVLESPKNNKSINLSSETISLFETMPPPTEKNICLELLHAHLEMTIEDFDEDPEALVLIMYEMYSIWYEEKTVDS